MAWVLYMVLLGLGFVCGLMDFSSVCDIYYTLRCSWVVFKQYCWALEKVMLNSNGAV